MMIGDIIMKKLKDKDIDAIEQKATIIINNYEFNDYLVESRNIAWGDTILFLGQTTKWNLKLQPVTINISEILCQNKDNDEISQEIAEKAIVKVKSLIRDCIENCQFEGLLRDYHRAVKVVLEGSNMFNGEEFTFKVGVGMLL